MNDHSSQTIAEGDCSHSVYDSMLPMGIFVPRGGAPGILSILVLGFGCSDVSTTSTVEPPVEGTRRPNIVWVITDTADLAIEHRSDWVGAVPFTVAVLDTLVNDAKLARSALLTGAHPDTLGLDPSTGHFTTVPPAGIAVIAEHLRRAGYYTSRSGPVQHQLSANVVELSPTVDSDSGVTQSTLLGAWDNAGPDASWRDKYKDWEFPCTVSFGCGQRKLHEQPFFSVFSMRGSSSPNTKIGRLLEQLDAEGFTSQTAVFVVGLGNGPARVGIRWPHGQRLDVSTNETISVLDLAPMALTLAGVPIPSHMRGRSLLLVEESLLNSSGSSVDPDETTAVGGAPTAATPEAYPTGGLFHVAPRVELWCDTPNSTIVYTTEREGPFYWRLYQEPFRMRFWELRVQCGRLGYRNSEVVTYEFDIE